MKNKVLIIGAGLGGLALAQGLAKAGISATVYERDESPTSRPQGYRISIRSLGIHALSEVLPHDKISRLNKAKVADVGDAFICANEKMEPYFKVPQGHDAAVQFLRAELRELLQEGVEIKWNKRLVAFEDNGNRVMAHFEDGSCAEGDLLVGCDGSSSSVRELMPKVYGKGVQSLPNVIQSHRAILGGQLDRTLEWDTLLPLNKEGMVRFLGRDSYDLGVCFSERADRSPTVFWAISEEIKDRNASWYPFDNTSESRKRILAHCKERIKRGGWHANLQKLIHSTPPEEIMAPWLVRTTQFPEAGQYPMVTTGRTTLLGDAAHPMPTDKALGGNNALEDARLLSALLAASPHAIDWSKLIEPYEREMFARAKAAIQETEKAAEYFRSLSSKS